MKISTLHLLSFCLLIQLCSSCDFQRVDTSKISDEIRSRQIKHITPSQIIALSNDFGQKIKISLNKNPVQSLLDSTLTDSLEKSFKVKITLLRPSDLTNTNIDAKVRALLDAYLYNDEKQLPQQDNLQPISNGMEVVFTTPVIFDKKMFSQVVKLSEKIGQPLKIKAIGSLLGVWAVTFERKNLVNQIDVKAFGRMKVRK